MSETTQLTATDHAALTSQLTTWEGFLSTGIGPADVPGQMRKAFAKNEIWQRIAEVESYKATQQELSTVPLDMDALTGRVNALRQTVEAMKPQAPVKEGDTSRTKGLSGPQIGLISTLALLSIGITATALHRAGLTAHLSSFRPFA